MSRQGGKMKPLKQPKKDKKEEGEDDKAFKEKKKAEEAALKAARDRAAKGGPPPSGGIKKMRVIHWGVCLSITVTSRTVFTSNDDGYRPPWLARRTGQRMGLSLPIPSPPDSNSTYLSSLPRSARASWTRTTADNDGRILVSHLSVPWEQIRSTEGWAGFQHVSVLRGWLTVHPPRSTCIPEDDRAELDPFLRVNLLRGAFFTVLPSPTSTERQEHIPEWHIGNVYAMSRAPAQLVKLPASPRGNMGEGGTKYEVIICGAYENFLLHRSTPRILRPTARQRFLFNIHRSTPSLLTLSAENPSAKPLESAYDQSTLGNRGGGLLPMFDYRTSSKHAIVPFRVTLAEDEYVSEKVTELVVELTCSLSVHVVRPSETTHAKNVDNYTPIRATYFFARSMVTAFTLVPPKFPSTKPYYNAYTGRGVECTGNEPILALHGAGVDILTQPWWANSLPRQKHAWIVIPQGRTEWGLDWHGPSAADAFSAVTALSRILFHGPLKWRDWGFNANTRVVLVGHSNGGQVIPAAGYIKSQAYVPWNLSRFSHFIDPFLRAILETSLTPDDNDLFLSNLVGTPILALHGYHEDPGRPHWYPEVFKSDCVQAFLDRLYSPSPVPVLHRISDGNAASARRQGRFTLTVAVPHESGSMHGWRVCALSTPGLTWLDARRGNLGTAGCGEGDGRREVRKWHVVFIFDVDGDELVVEVEDDREGSIFGRSFQRKAQIQVTLQPRQRLQAILSSTAPLTLLIPSLSLPHELSAAASYIIISLEELNSLTDVGEGNLVVIGCAREPLVQAWLERTRSVWMFKDGAWCFSERRKFCRPSSDLNGLERAVRLFPIRTGVLSPDWIVVGGRADGVGTAGVEGAGVYASSCRGDWAYNEQVSWFD
ncbi:hypothetical protein EDD16DRAFT_1520024 [Pisolithus croceorrhizus]|nr:hypothetical protein EDD16DRAFT_1520024 [Pisolithus croceorrhizus]